MKKKIRAARLLLRMGENIPDSFFIPPKPKGYVLTDKDKLDIASKVSVPLVEKSNRKSRED